MGRTFSPWQRFWARRSRQIGEVSVGPVCSYTAVELEKVVTRQLFMPFKVIEEEEVSN